MHVLIVCGLLFASMVHGDQNIEKHHYGMDIEGIHIEEDVEVHKKERFAKIEIPATRNRSAVTIIQDFDQNLTQYRQSGQCYMLSNFDGFSTGMDDWMEMQEYDETAVADADKEVRLYNFTASPFHKDSFMNKAFTAEAVVVCVM